MGNSGAMLKVKALSSISIEDVELAIGDADQSTAPKVNSNFYTKTALRYFVNIPLLPKRSCIELFFDIINR